MKAIVCELCGSNDIVKQDGLFVCQHCGTKYTLDEARKLMSNDVVTVKVDNTTSVANHLEIARNACKTSNYTEAESYANKILEMDPECAEAWEIKGVAAGWQSTLGNVRFGESIECWSKAVSLSQGEETDAIKKRIGPEMEKLVIALVSTKANNFSSLPSQSSFQGLADCDAIFASLIGFSLKIGSAEVDINRAFDNCAIIMADAARNGKTFADRSYGPEKSDQNRYAYLTWLERVGYCITLFDLAATLAKDEITVSRIANSARATIRSYIDSKCYKFEVYEYGGSGYVEDSTISSFERAKRESEIQNWNKREKELIEEIQKNKREKYEEGVKNYWEEHLDEKEKLEQALVGIKAEKDNSITTQILDLDALVAEVEGALANKDETHIQKLLGEIEGKGIIQSRYEEEYSRVSQLVRPETSIDDLETAEKKLTLFGDYNEAKELLQKCTKYLSNAREREIEAQKREVDRLYQNLNSASKTKDIEAFRSRILAFDKVVDKDEVNRIADEKIRLIRKKKKKIAIIIVSCVVFVVLCAAALLIFKKRIKYTVALAKYNGGEYNEAIDAFKQLKGYSDSDGMIDACNYELARIEYEKGNYENAAKMYKELGTYKDSKEKHEEAQTNQAEELIKEGKYLQAQNLLYPLPDSPDRNEMKTEIQYQFFKNYFENGETDAMVAAYEKVKGYKDADELFSQGYYKIGKEQLNNKEYKLACDSLSNCLDYLDSKELYAKAEKLAVDDEKFNELIDSMHFCEFNKVDRLLEEISDEYMKENPQAKAFKQAWPTFDKKFAGAWYWPNSNSTATVLVIHFINGRFGYVWLIWNYYDGKNMREEIQESFETEYTSFFFERMTDNQLIDASASNSSEILNTWTISPDGKKLTIYDNRKNKIDKELVKGNLR